MLFVRKTFHQKQVFFLQHQYRIFFLENVFYLIGSYDEWMSVGISRALTAVPGHFGFGVLMGYYYSLGKFDSETFASAKYKALIVPILVHGIYDVICFVIGIVPSVAFILMIVFIVFCHKLWKYGSKRIKEHLERDKVIDGMDI